MPGKQEMNVFTQQEHILSVNQEAPSSIFVLFAVYLMDEAFVPPLKTE
jgi:hypothetical protein